MLFKRYEQTQRSTVEMFYIYLGAYGPPDEIVEMQNETSIQMDRMYF